MGEVTRIVEKTLRLGDHQSLHLNTIKQHVIDMVFGPASACTWGRRKRRRPSNDEVDEGDEVHQAVPMDFDKAEIKRDWI